MRLERIPEADGTLPRFCSVISRNKVVSSCGRLGGLQKRGDLLKEAVTEFRGAFHVDLRFLTRIDMGDACCAE